MVRLKVRAPAAWTPKFTALDDDEFLELCDRGYDTQQIASALHSDINLVALKADTLISQGYRLRRQEHRNTFLK